MTPSKHIAELWTSKVNGKKYSDQYLFIYEKKGKELYALVHHKTVFLKYEKQYYKVNSDSLNEVLSFLMKESWTFETGRASVGLGKNGGTDYQKRYDIVLENIELPTAEKFKIETIKVIN